MPGLLLGASPFLPAKYKYLIKVKILDFCLAHNAMRYHADCGAVDLTLNSDLTKGNDAAAL